MGVIRLGATLVAQNKIYRYNTLIQIKINFLFINCKVDRE